MKPVPLMILSDAPTASSGFGRIARDLATRIANHLPEFEVATFGMGGYGSRKLPFRQYNMRGVTDWVPHDIPAVWRDFAGDRKGVLLVIWDASRFRWLSNPEMCANKELRDFLLTKPFQTWGYFPLDAEGITGGIPSPTADPMKGFDRVLMYSKWAANLASEELGYTVESLPHGIDTKVFYPRTGVESLKGIEKFFTPDKFVVGINATNQSRKDYGTAIAALSIIAQKKPLRAWIHTDRLEGQWSIPALINEYNLNARTIVTVGEFTDAQLAESYSASNVTMSIGLGEGFGYTTYESLACGVPAVLANYAGAEWLPDAYKLKPVAWQADRTCMSRPVLTPEQWAEAVIRVADQKACLPEELRWDVLWNRWTVWLKEGIENGS